MIVKAINDIAGYNNIVLILLIFKTFFYITSNDVLTLSITKRIKAINIVITKVIKFYAKR